MWNGPAKAGLSRSRAGLTHTAHKERERLMGRVHAGQRRVSRETVAGSFERYLDARKPYLQEGT